MSFLFGGDSAPAPQAVPVAPAKDAGALAARDMAALDAQLASKSRGRRSTIVGGLQIAADEQEVRGARRAAARELG